MTRIEDLTPGRWRGTRADHGCCPGLDEGFAVHPWRAIATPQFVDSWRALAGRAATPNPFYEPWFLLPSLEQFDPHGKVWLAVLVRAGELVALMPLWRTGEYYGRTLPHLADWTHPNSFCGVPLVAERQAPAFWTALLDWADRNRRLSAFLHLGSLPVDSAEYRALTQVCDGQDRPLAAVRRFARAALVQGATPEEHLDRALDRKRRKELSRKRRRLEETGELVFTRHTDTAGLDQWINRFMALEHAGWKGAEGSSLASAPQTAAFFRATLVGAAQAGRLERLEFQSDGRAVAMLCSFITPPHAFSFKTTFDETLSRLSPGMLLQVENLALLSRPDIVLTDSCAAPHHPMIEQVWDDRRAIASVSVGIGGTLRRRLGALLSAIELRRSETRR